MKNLMKRATVAVAAVALMGSAVAVNYVQAADSAMVAKVGKPAKQFKLQDQNGKSVSLSDYAGKLVVLEWTNPECPVVQRHYKSDTMKDLEKKYAAQGVVWLAINSTHDTTNSADLAWASAQSISYPILNDASGATGHAYGAKSTPGMYIIDKTGNLAYSGAIDNDPMGDKSEKTNYVSQALDQLLAGKTVTVAETKSYGCGVHYAE